MSRRLDRGGKVTKPWTGHFGLWQVTVLILDCLEASLSLSPLLLGGSIQASALAV